MQRRYCLYLVHFVFYYDAVLSPKSYKLQISASIRLPVSNFTFIVVWRCCDLEAL